MEVQVSFDSSPDEQTDEVRELATRRARFALRRLLALAPRAQVRLSGISGRRGHPDKRCQVKLETEGAGFVIATATAREWRAAVDHALARAVRRLVHLGRRSWDNHGVRSHVLRFPR